MHFWGLESSSSLLPFNLARDEALLTACDGRPGSSALRIWEQPSLAIVLGASCRIDEDVQRDHCLDYGGVTMGRRASGGGTVVIGPGVMCVAVALPISSHPALSAVDTAQRYVLDRLAQPLRNRGVPIVIQGSGDWTVVGRKCAGSAQRRLRTHVLIHASVLYEADMEAIGGLLKPPRRQPEYRAGRGHSDFLTNLPMTRDPLTQALGEAWNPPAGWLPPLEVDGLVLRLVDEKYGRSDWTERF